MKKFLAGVVLMIVVCVGIFSYFYINTDIPKLYLDGDITSMVSKDEKSKVAFRYDDGSHEVAGFAEVKYQGNSSLEYQKKNYTIWQLLML
ncbi:MAG: hypothetical protein IKC59_08480 [Clostridia bacterium]|nr:hypothetical protein [Clostridia bacterium]